MFILTIVIVAFLITSCLCAVASCPRQLPSTDSSELDFNLEKSVPVCSCLDVNSTPDPHNLTLSEILDKMIPLKTVRTHEGPFDPWFDGECRTSKCLKRSLERIYIKTKNENDFAEWLGQMKLYKRLCRHKRREYWNTVLCDPKTKRLTFGATLIVSLVKERNLLLTEFHLLKSNLIFFKLSQQITQPKPEKNLFL